MMMIGIVFSLVLQVQEMKLDDTRKVASSVRVCVEVELVSAKER